MRPVRESVESSSPSDGIVPSAVCTCSEIDRHEPHAKISTTTSIFSRKPNLGPCLARKLNITREVRTPIRLVQINCGILSAYTPETIYSVSAVSRNTRRRRTSGPITGESRLSRHSFIREIHRRRYSQRNRSFPKRHVAATTLLAWNRPTFAHNTVERPTNKNKWSAYSESKRPWHTQYLSKRTSVNVTQTRSLDSF